MHTLHSDSQPTVQRVVCHTFVRPLMLTTHPLTQCTVPPYVRGQESDKPQRAHNSWTCQETRVNTRTTIYSSTLGSAVLWGHDIISDPFLRTFYMTFVIYQSTYQTRCLLIALMITILLIYNLLSAHKNSTSYEYNSICYGVAIDLYGKILG